MIRVDTAQRERCLQFAVADKTAAVKVEACGYFIDMIHLCTNLPVVTVVVGNITTVWQAFIINRGCALTNTDGIDRIVPELQLNTVLKTTAGAE